MSDKIIDINVLAERALQTKADRQKAASWIGRTAHEIGLLTGFDGGRAYRNAKCMANVVLSDGGDLSDVDPIEYANHIFGRWRELNSAPTAPAVEAGALQNDREREVEEANRRDDDSFNDWLAAQRQEWRDAA